MVFPPSPSPKGDVVEVMQDDDSGWIHARKDGAEGYVPKTYLEMIAGSLV